MIDQLPERELRLLVALAQMCDQYMHSYNSDFIDTACMSAGELAIVALEQYGVVSIEPPGQFRSARWTEAGIALRDDPRY